MALELHDTDSVDATLTSGDTETLIVESATAEHFEVIVDDGAGGVPSTYDLTVEFYSTAVDAYMQVDSVSGVTARSPAVRNDARGQRVRVKLTAGTGADYRVSVESHKET